MSGKTKENGKWSIVEAIAQAESDGFTVIKTSPERLLVDLDGDDRLPLFDQQFELLKERFKLSEIERYRSKSGLGWHIVLRCAPLKTETRLLLQACLGSDLKREALGFLMFCDGIQDPSVLFKPTVKAVAA